jgi:hypothetical protein
MPSVVLLPNKRTDLEKLARKLFPQTAGYRLHVLNSRFMCNIACWSNCFPIYFICYGQKLFWLVGQIVRLGKLSGPDICGDIGKCNTMSHRT